MKDKINYYNTPNAQRQSNGFIKWMTHFLEFSKPKKNTDKNYLHEEKDKYQNLNPADDIFKQEKNE